VVSDADSEAAAASLTRARERLERISEPFAARRMQRALSAGMAGKSLDEIEAALAEEGLDARRGGHSAALIQDDDEHGE
jgi:molecular chaperone HscA